MASKKHYVRGNQSDLTAETSEDGIGISGCGDAGIELQDIKGSSSSSPHHNSLDYENIHHESVTDEIDTSRRVDDFVGTRDLDLSETNRYEVDDLEEGEEEESSGDDNETQIGD
jgi:hypothetical protein